MGYEEVKEIRDNYQGEDVRIDALLDYIDGLKEAIAYVKPLPPLVGNLEAAELLGWDRRKFNMYHVRGVMPKPVQVLKCGSIWTKQQILDYAHEKGIEVHEGERDDTE